MICLFNAKFSCPVSLGCKIHRLHLCRWVRAPDECPGSDAKQSAGEVSVLLELWGMQRIPSLSSLPGPFELEIEKFLTIKLRTYAKLNCFKWNCFLRLKLSLH